MAFGGFREFKTAFFQSLIVKGKPARPPVKEFDQVALFVHKNKYIPIEWVGIKVGVHHTRQAIKAFSHIGGLGIEAIGVGGAEAKHYTSCTRALKSDSGLSCGNLTLTPLGYSISNPALATGVSCTKPASTGPFCAFRYLVRQ